MQGVIERLTEDRPQDADDAVRSDAPVSPLRRARFEHNLTVNDLRTATGVGRNAIYNIENGSRTPSADQATRIAGFLGVPVADLFSWVADGRRSRIPGRCTRQDCIRPAVSGGACTEHKIDGWPLPPPVVTSEMPRLGWVEESACLDTEDPDAWYPNDGYPNEVVVDTCSGCPVRGDCFVASQSGPSGPEDDGVWAGMTRGARDSYRRQLERSGMKFVRRTHPLFVQG